MGRPARGQRRIDAAIDALRPMGFQEPHIRNAVHQLLNVYGDGGWLFIEEASYKLVVEKLLEEEEKEEEPDKQIQEQKGNEVLPEEPNMKVAEIAQQNGIGDGMEAQPLQITIRHRPPAYGWISESDSDSDEAHENESKCQICGLPARERQSGWNMEHPN